MNMSNIGVEAVEEGETTDYQELLPGSPENGEEEGQMDVQKPRLFYIDVLRFYATILVLLHHCLIAYMGFAIFSFSKPLDMKKEPVFGSIAMTIVTWNQSWFMMAFFTLAGYFTPSSFRRKKFGKFIADRFIRLGVPFLLYYFVIGVLCTTLGHNAQFPSWPVTFGQVWLNYWNNEGQFYPGPSWFVEILFVFSLIYAVGAHIFGKMANSNSSEVKKSKSTLWLKYSQKYPFATMMAIALIISGITFPIRVSYGMRWVPYVMFMPNFITSYAFGFFFGPWIVKHVPKCGLVVPSVATFLLLSGYITLWNVAGYSIAWDGLSYGLAWFDITVGMSTMVLVFNLFHKYANLDLKSKKRGNRLLAYCTACSYTAYLTHEFWIDVIGGYIIAPLADFVGNWLLSILCFVLLVPLTYIVCGIIRLIPGTKRVLG